MNSVPDTPEEDIKAAREILHGSEDGEMRHIKNSPFGHCVPKVAKDPF